MSRANPRGPAAFLAAVGGLRRPAKRRREPRPSKIRTFAELRMRFLQDHRKRPDAETEAAEAAAIEKACAPSRP